MAKTSVVALRMNQAAAAAFPHHSLEPKTFLELPATAILAILAACSAEAERALRCTCSTLAAMPKAQQPLFVALKAMANPAKPGRRASSEIFALFSVCECNQATIRFITACKPQPACILMQPDLACWMMAYAGRAGDFAAVDWLLKVSQPDQAAALRKKYTTLYDKAWIAATGHAAAGDQTAMLAALLELPCSPGGPAGPKSLSIELQTALLFGAVCGPTPSTALSKLKHLCLLSDADEASVQQWAAEEDIDGSDEDPANQELAEAMADACVLAARAGYVQAIPAFREHGLELSTPLLMRLFNGAIQHDNVEMVESLVHMPWTIADSTSPSKPLYIAKSWVVKWARSAAFARTPLPAVNCMLAIDKLYCNDEDAAWVPWHKLISRNSTRALAALLEVPKYVTEFRSQTSSAKADLLGTAAGNGNMSLLEMLVKYGALPNTRSLEKAAKAYSDQPKCPLIERRAKLACCHKLLEILLTNSDCSRVSGDGSGFDWISSIPAKQQLGEHNRLNQFDELKEAGLLHSPAMLRSFCMMGERHLVKQILNSLNSETAQMVLTANTLNNIALLCSKYCNSRSELLYLAIQLGASTYAAVTAAFRADDVLLLVNLLEDINNHYNGITTATSEAADEDAFLSYSDFAIPLQQRHWGLSQVSEKHDHVAVQLNFWLAEYSVGEKGDIQQTHVMNKARWALELLLQKHQWASPSAALLWPSKTKPYTVHRVYKLLEWLLDTFGWIALDKDCTPGSTEIIKVAEMIARNAPIPFTVLLAKHGACSGQLICGLAARENPPLHLIQQLVSGQQVGLAKQHDNSAVNQANDGFQLSDREWKVAVRGALQNENIELLGYLIEQGPGWLEAAKMCRPDTKPHILDRIVTYASVADFSFESLSQIMEELPMVLALPMVITATKHLDANEVLLAAVKSGSIPAVETLLRHYKADPYYLLQQPIIFAAQSGHTELVEYLLDRGACCHAALYGAVLGRQVELVEKLVDEREAEASWEDGAAITLAVESGDQQLVNALLGDD